VSCESFVLTQNSKLMGASKKLLLSRERAKYSPALAEGQNCHRHSQCYVEDEVWPDNTIAAVRSKNEFLEVTLQL
jgi:hypothetical protein